MMKGVQFPEVTTVLGAPPGMEKEVYGLPVWRDAMKPEVISCWRGDWRDRLRFLITGTMWLRVWAPTHHPLLLQTEYPFEPDSWLRAAGVAALRPRRWLRRQRRWSASRTYQPPQ